MPEGWARDFVGDGEVDHEVPEEVSQGADGEDDVGRGELVDEAGQDAKVGAQVLEEGEGV